MCAQIFQTEIYMANCGQSPVVASSADVNKLQALRRSVHEFRVIRLIHSIIISIRVLYSENVNLVSRSHGADGSYKRRQV